VKRTVVRAAISLCAIPLALFVTWFAMVGYQDWRYINRWERIQRGDTEERILKVMGRPHRVVFERSTYAPWATEHKVQEYEVESVKQFRYVPFSFTGEEYGIGFDSSGHAVSKFHITSP
jgi:hypothetical protein